MLNIASLEAVSAEFSRYHEALMKEEGLFVGQLVQVRSADEILSMVDDNGTLDGLPFMPEMLSWCGKLFHVQRRVDKTCVDGGGNRRFPANDVVVLDGPRCDGSSHDGCKHGVQNLLETSVVTPVDSADARIEPPTPVSTNCEFILK